MNMLPSGIHLSLIPENAYLVVAKYMPRRDSEDYKFFTLLESDDIEVKVMFPGRVFKQFHCGDSLVIDGNVSISRDGWLRLPADFALQVFPAAVQGQETTFDLQYVASPRRIADSHWYMSNIGDSWLHISYDTARRYFVGSKSNGTTISEYGSYYASLGMSKEATPDEIRVAWRKLARQWHPDTNPLANATETMAQINEAYDTLSDPKARQDYDRLLSGPVVQGRDEGVKAWPGRGFGKLRCICEDRGDTILVREILSFRRNRMTQSAVVPIANVDFANYGVGIGIDELHEQVWLDESDLPFVPAAVLNDVKDSLPGECTYRIESVQRGWWDRERGRSVSKWEVQSCAVEWSDDLMDAIHSYLVGHRYASQLRNAVSEARKQMQTQGVLLTFGDIAAEFQVDVADLEGSFWRPEYDRNFAEKLATESMDGTWGYSAEYLVFQMRNNVVVLERPVHGAATYIFKAPMPEHPEGPQSVGQLVGVMQEISLLELRRNVEVQQRLNYLGFAIHNEQESWWRKVAGFVFT